MLSWCFQPFDPLTFLSETASDCLWPWARQKIQKNRQAVISNSMGILASRRSLPGNRWVVGGEMGATRIHCLHGCQSLFWWEQNTRKRTIFLKVLPGCLFWDKSICWCYKCIISVNLALYLLTLSQLCFKCGSRGDKGFSVDFFPKVNKSSLYLLYWKKKKNHIPRALL